MPVCTTRARRRATLPITWTCGFGTVWIIAGRPLAAASSSVDSGSKWLPWAAAKLVQSSPVAASRIASNRPRFSLQKGNAVHICTTRHRRYIFAPHDIECNVWGTRFGTGAAPALRGWVGEFERLDKFLQHGHVLRRFVFSVLVGIRCFDRRPRRLQDPRKRKAKLSRKRPEAYHLPRRLQMKQTRLRLHKCDDNRESCDGVHKGCTLGSGAESFGLNRH